jgi:hypothetical protein
VKKDERKESIFFQTIKTEHGKVQSLGAIGYDWQLLKGQDEDFDKAFMLTPDKLLHITDSIR